MVFLGGALSSKGLPRSACGWPGHSLYEGKQRYGIYKQLGTLETADVVDFVQYLRRQPYVEKVYGMGWSFGGYVAARLAMEAPPDALALALYPSRQLRTGACMTLPTPSALCRPLPKTPKAMNVPVCSHSSRRLQAPLLLIHGEADDNVHVQQSYLLIERLLGRAPESPLTWRIYPGQNHGIGRYRYHLFLEVERFMGIRE